MDKKSSMMKDAIILCAITLILGAVLAGVYMLTKDPIDNAQKKTNNEACAVVVAQGDSVKDNDAEAVSGAAAGIGVSYVLASDMVVMGRSVMRCHTPSLRTHTG